MRVVSLLGLFVGVAAKTYPKTETTTTETVDAEKHHLGVGATPTVFVANKFIKARTAHGPQKYKPHGKVRVYSAYTDQTVSWQLYDIDQKCGHSDGHRDTHAETKDEHFSCAITISEGYCCDKAETWEAKKKGDPKDFRCHEDLDPGPNIFAGPDVTVDPWGGDHQKYVSMGHGKGDCMYLDGHQYCHAGFSVGTFTVDTGVQEEVFQGLSLNVYNYHGEQIACAPLERISEGDAWEDPAADALEPYPDLYENQGLAPI